MPVHLPNRRQVLALLSLPLCAPLAAQTQRTPADVKALVDAVIPPLMARHQVPGMAVALTVRGQDHVFHHGLASKTDARPVNDATLFEIGSISKVFTATLAAYAQATGRLSLQDTPGRHLPALRGRPIDRATLGHLGTYTAGGLPLQFPDNVRDDAAALDYFRQWQPEAAPGAQRFYSNPSIGLLGEATAAAMGGPFTALVQQHLLRPLGLQHTHFQVPPAAMADYAWGHRAGQPVRVNPGPMDAAAYGLKTTAGDLLRFLKAQIDPTGLPAPLREALRTTQAGRYRAGPMVQGLGWEQLPYPSSREWMLGSNAAEMLFEPQPVQAITDAAASGTPAPRQFGKTGSTGGFSAYVLFVPSERFALVLLANGNLPIPARIEAAQALLKGLTP